jgi:hypothetical protein
MIVKLIALVIAMSNGQPVGDPLMEPLARYQFGPAFASHEACMAFFDSTAGIAARRPVESQVAASGEGFDVMYSCAKESD